MSRIVTCPVCRGTMQWKDKNTMICSCGYEIKVKRTNADRIRAMTDEELAENVIVLANDDYCGGPDRCKGRSCYKCRLEWLKKEVKNG